MELNFISLNSSQKQQKSYRLSKYRKFFVHEKQQPMSAYFSTAALMLKNGVLKI